MFQIQNPNVLVSHMRGKNARTGHPHHSLYPPQLSSKGRHSWRIAHTYAGGHLRSALGTDRIPTLLHLPVNAPCIPLHIRFYGIPERIAVTAPTALLDLIIYGGPLISQIFVPRGSKLRARRPSLLPRAEVTAETKKSFRRGSVLVTINHYVPPSLGRARVRRDF